MQAWPQTAEAEEPVIRVLTVREASQIIKINQAAVRRLIRNGELTASRIGRLWRIRIEAIEEFLDAKSNSGSEG